MKTVNYNLIGLIASIILGPMILFGAKFGLGASLLDGIGGSYSNSGLQETVVTAGLLTVLLGMIAAPFFGAKLLRGVLHTGLIVLIGLGFFAAPFVLYVLIAGLPS